MRKWREADGEGQEGVKRFGGKAKGEVKQNVEKGGRWRDREWVERERERKTGRETETRWVN